MRSLIIPSLLVLAGCGSSGSDCAEGFGLASDGNCYPIDMTVGGGSDDTATDDTAGNDTAVDTVDTGDTEDTNDTVDTNDTADTSGGGGDTSGGSSGGGDTSGGSSGGGSSGGGDTSGGSSGGGSSGGGDTSGGGSSGGSSGGGSSSGGTDTSGGGGGPPDAGGNEVTFDGTVAVTTALSSGATCGLALFDGALGGSAAAAMLDFEPFTCPTAAGSGAAATVSEIVHTGTSTNVHAYIIVDGDARIGHVEQLLSDSPYTTLADGDSVTFSVTLNTD